MHRSITCFAFRRGHWWIALKTWRSVLSRFAGKRRPKNFQFQLPSHARYFFHFRVEESDSRKSGEVLRMLTWPLQNARRIAAELVHGGVESTNAASSWAKTVGHFSKFGCRNCGD